MTELTTTHEEAGDDPLSQAMSMLDSLGGDGGGSNDFEDFAIDSDDDDDNENINITEDVNLNDLNLEGFDNDREFSLGSVDLLDNTGTGGAVKGGGSSPSKSTSSVAAAGGGGAGSNETMTGQAAQGIGISQQTSSEVDELRDNLQGKLSGDHSTTAATPGAAASGSSKVINIRAAIPPAYWATKQDVAELNSGGGGAEEAGGGGKAGTIAVNSTTATSLPSKTTTTATTNTANPTAATSTSFEHPLAHPLQNVPPTAATSSSSAPGVPTSNTSTNSWTSSFASFASRAAASVQNAVENAEAAVLHQQHQYQQQHQIHHGGAQQGGLGVGGGMTHSLQQNQQPQPRQQGGLYSSKSINANANNATLNSNAAAAATTTTGVVGVQGGASTQQPMTSKSISMSYQERQKLLHQQYHAKTTTTPRASPATVASTASGLGSTPSPSPVSSAPPSPQKVSTTVVQPTTTEPITSSTQATPTTNTLQSQPSFIDKLTSSLDTPTKTSLITSALGKLLPGERVIMFLNSLKDVKDSSFGHAFVGSDDVLLARGLGDILLTNKSGGGVEEGHDNTGGEKGSNCDDVVTVWCCVMTFYRVAVFSYQANRLNGKVLLDDSEEKGGEERKTKTEEEEDVISQWIQSQNVSVQFQAAHCLPGSSKRGSRRHHVFQMPLASIERVEKTLASSQRKAMAGASQSTSITTTSGYTSAYNAILPSSSTVSTASSAMVSLGSQMKVLGSLTTSSSNSNLLTNGGVGPTTTATTGGMSSMENNGPLGIILHGKDGGRTIQFSTLSYTDAQRAQEALNTYAFPGRRNLGYLFAFESRRAEVMASNPPPPVQQQLGQSATAAAGAAAATSVEGNPIATAAKPTRRRFVPLEEFERQGIFASRSGVYGPGYGNAFDGGVVSPIMSYASPWAPILNANANYGLCSTYPSVLVGPRSIVGDADLTNNISGHNNVSGHSSTASSTAGGMMDNGNIGLLRRCAAFRSENRFPVLTWGSSHHGGSIWRSSQPKVGLQGNRSVEDERYLYAIGEEAKRANLAADARAEGGVGGGTGSGKPPVEFLRMLCGRNNESDLIIEKGGVANSNSGCMLKIMDMRPKSAAMGNRTQGYGYENTNNYRGSTINFYGIGNIHAVRDAYQKVNALCLNPNTSDLQWMQLVENTNWPSMIRLILSASWQTAFHVHYNRLPVLVHCSHGWDRTSQVPALAQLLLDPHYRTREGFSTLVEKDFLSFGHPFHTRCGHGEGKNEQGGGDEGQLSPIFLQFLDCVFQLVNQFPDYFEFNTQYLLLLSEHIYSCRFGTLLCDSEREREVVAGIRQRTYCMWEYLDSVPELVNPMFDKDDSATAGVLLMPLPMLLRNVTLWTDRYCMYGAKATMPCVPSSLNHTSLAQSQNEQPMVLHTARNGVVEGALRRALDDVEMWKTTALEALKEVKELKDQRKHGEKTQSILCDGAS